MLKKVLLVLTFTLMPTVTAFGYNSCCPLWCWNPCWNPCPPCIITTPTPTFTITPTPTPTVTPTPTIIIPEPFEREDLLSVETF